MNNYPTKSELQDVLSTRLAPSRTRAFFRELGILLLSQNKSDLGALGAEFFLGCRDMTRLRGLLDDEANYRKSSRIYINNPQHMDDLLEVLAHRSADIAPGARVAVAQAGNSASIKIEYTKRRPGMNELLEQETHRVLITLEQINGQIAVGISHRDRGEYRVVEQIVEKAAALSVPNDVLSVEKVTLAALTLPERIELFNRFFTFEYEDWALRQVRKVALKKTSDEATEAPEGDVLDDEDEMGDQATPVELQGLTHALLEGSGLRENPFVRQCLDNGFYFSGTHVRLDNRTDPKVVDLNVSFGSGFCEINVIQTGLLEDDRLEVSPFPQAEQDRILDYFQDVMNRIFRQVKAERGTRAAD